jgi:hypothetical protein
MEELEVKEPEFHNLHALLDAGETVGDLVSAIEAIGICSQDKPRDEYGRAITNNCSVKEKKCADIKKKLAYYYRIDKLEKKDMLEEFGDWDDVEFLCGWGTPNKRPFYPPNIYLIYLNNGWYGNQYFDFKKGLVDKKNKGHGSNPTSRERQEPIQVRREKVLSGWISSEKVNVIEPLKETRQEIWDILKNISPQLFSACSQGSIKKFFDKQDECKTQIGSRSNKNR